MDHYAMLTVYGIYCTAKVTISGTLYQGFVEFFVDHSESQVNYRWFTWTELRITALQNSVCTVL